MWLYIKKNKFLYFMILPVILWYFIFMYIPMYGLVLAFQDYSFSAGYFGSKFIGLDNFKILVEDPNFRNAFWNTLIINFYRIVFGFPIPIILALLLNEIYHIKFKKIVQTITYLPHFISWIVLAGILNSFLSLDTGVINVILSKLGLEQINFFLENQYFRPMIIVTDIWKEVGWNTIIYLAAIAGVNPTLYEAATIDGANRFQKIIYVTIPCIRNVIAIMLILQIGNILQMGFDQVYNLYNPVVYESSDIIDTYIVRNLTNATNISIPAAAGLIKSCICFALLLLANFLAKRTGNQGIY